MFPGNCYSKVREETKAMQEAFGDDLIYNHPIKEVIVLYEDENPGEYQNEYIVKMNKKRPSWFSQSLLAKSK